MYADKRLEIPHPTHGRIWEICALRLHLIMHLPNADTVCTTYCGWWQKCTYD